MGYLTQANSALKHMKRRARKAANVIAFASIFIMPATAVAASPCPTVGKSALSQGGVAIKVRRLQTTLMVAALSCNARSYYNDFVIRHRPSLQRYGKAIKLEFQRRHGRNGPKELNRFITHLANDASARSNADREAFCSDALAVFQQAETRGKTLAHIVAGPASMARIASVSCDAATAASFHLRANGADAPNR